MPHKYGMPFPRSRSGFTHGSRLGIAAGLQIVSRAEVCRRPPFDRSAESLARLWTTYPYSARLRSTCGLLRASNFAFAYYLRLHKASWRRGGQVPSPTCRKAIAKRQTASSCWLYAPSGWNGTQECSMELSRPLQ
jgi:hypothetical protein